MREIENDMSALEISEISQQSQSLQALSNRPVSENPIERRRGECYRMTNRSENVRLAQKISDDESMQDEQPKYQVDLFGNESDMNSLNGYINAMNGQ